MSCNRYSQGYVKNGLSWACHETGTARCAPWNRCKPQKRLSWNLSWNMLHWTCHETSTVLRWLLRGRQDIKIQLPTNSNKMQQWHTYIHRHSSGVSYETVKYMHWNKLCIYCNNKNCLFIRIHSEPTLKHQTCLNTATRSPVLLQTYIHSVVFPVKQHQPLQHAQSNIHCRSTLQQPMVRLWSNCFHDTTGNSQRLSLIWRTAEEQNLTLQALDHT